MFDCFLQCDNGLQLTWYNNIDPDNIAVMGFSAGGIQAGEFLMHYDENITPDVLDTLSVLASACGMIYSFYGRLSAGNMDKTWLA